MSGRIVVGVDGSDVSIRALIFAVGEARTRGCDLEAVHAWQWESPLRVKMGPSAPTLLEVAAGAVLLVVGTGGRGGFAGLFLGSTSLHCAQHPTCPLAIVP